MRSSVSREGLGSYALNSCVNYTTGIGGETDGNDHDNA